jgi:hypothetical protein
VVTASASGTFTAGTTLYSVSADANLSTHINVHVLSDVIVRSFFSAQGIDPDVAFSNPAGANAAPTPAAVQSLASLLLPVVQFWLNNAGVNATPGPPSNGSINVISSPFAAYPAGVTPTTGLDAVLHLITSETIDPGAVTNVTITNGTVTEKVTPSYTGVAVTLNTRTTNTATGVSSSESFTSLVIDSANQSVVTAINSQLAAFATTVNTNGSAPTGTELLPFYAPDYLNDGENAMEDTNSLVANLGGSTINSLVVQTIKSLNTATDVADVIAAFNVTAGGQNQSGTAEYFFRNEGGTFLFYGDQQIASAQAGPESRISQGAPSVGSGATTLPSGALWQTDILAGASAPTSLGVTQVTVSGGGNIWFGAASETLTHGSTEISNGQNFDQFYGLSQNLGNNVLNLVNAPFTFNFTATASGNPRYRVLSSPAATTEAIQLLDISNAVGKGLLSSVLRQTITYQWSLPTTYAIGQVSLAATSTTGL